MATTQPKGAQREFSRGTLELAILALIQSKPRYGYDLLTSLIAATDGALEVKEGTLYPVLHRLEDAGYIEALSRLGTPREAAEAFSQGYEPPIASPSRRLAAAITDLAAFAGAAI